MYSTTQELKNIPGTNPPILSLRKADRRKAPRNLHSSGKIAPHIPIHRATLIPILTRSRLVNHLSEPILSIGDKIHTSKNSPQFNPRKYFRQYLSYALSLPHHLYALLAIRYSTLPRTYNSPTQYPIYTLQAFPAHTGGHYSPILAHRPLYIAP